MIYLSYASAWISTTVAITLGMYFTHSPWCLLAFAFPSVIRLRHHCKDEENEDEEESKNNE